MTEVEIGSGTIKPGFNRQRFAYLQGSGQFLDEILPGMKINGAPFNQGYLLFNRLV